jgi:heat shock protein HslJ
VAAVLLGLATCVPGSGAAAWAPVGTEAATTLARHHWRLESATDAKARRIDALELPAPRAFVLGFAGSQVVVEGGCNSMRGGYAIDAPGRITIGRMAATMMACDGALMRADAALARLLAGPLTAAVDDGAAPRLRLVTAGGDTLVLAGRPTPEARYGPATLMFLEVAPRRVPCSAPPMRDATCLQVRERVFDAQGLPVGTPGDWRMLAGEIEGFAHRDGVRNVLRVKRFERSPAPADAPAAVYVLDLVVESEVVKP